MSSSFIGSSRVSGSMWQKAALYAAALASTAAAMVLASSSVWAAAPVFPTSDNDPVQNESATVTILAVGEGQTKVGPPVRAVDTDGNPDGNGNRLVYSLSDGDLFHASFFTIDSSTGQISLRPHTRRGVYQVKVSASDGTDTATVDVTIYVTSPGHHPWEDAWVEARSMTASDGSADDWFGFSVDADDEIIVVGAFQGGDTSTVTNPGAAYVFDADNGRQLVRLSSPNPVTDGFFGWKVDVVGDMIFVGAPMETVSTSAKSGRVYAFTKPAGGWTESVSSPVTFTPDSTLVSMGGTTTGVEFGTGLAVSDDGNTVVVGASHWENVGDSSDVAGLDQDGALFVFTKAANASWANADTDDTGVVRLYAGSRVRRYAELGANVAISSDGSTIAAAAPAARAGEGYVYMFPRPTNGVWVNTTDMDAPARLSVTGRHRQQQLGARGLGISDDGSTVAAGASVVWRKDQADDSLIPADAKGSAYVFTRPADGVWADATETAKFATFGHRYDLFGGGIAISASGNKIAVTNSDSRSSNFRGSVYVYTKPAGGWADDLTSQGGNVRVLTAAAADTNARQRYGFGGRGLAFVGEDALAVGQHAFVWALYRKDNLATLTDGGVFGANVDMTDVTNVPQGSAYLFKLRAAAQQQQPVAPPPPPPPPPPDEPEEQPEPEPEPEPPEFVDVDEDSVHAESIEEVAALGITVGTTPTMFSPDQAVSRGQMATFLTRTWEAAGRECPTSGVGFFDDVASGSTHVRGIDCMSALDVARGTAARMFAPSESVSRGQMATFLARAWEAAGRECPADTGLPFDDVPAGSTHAAGISCMSALGIARGAVDGTFSPSATVTRAQMATFLARFHGALTDTA